MYYLDILSPYQIIHIFFHKTSLQLPNVIGNTDIKMEAFKVVLLISHSTSKKIEKERSVKDKLQNANTTLNLSPLF